MITDVPGVLVGHHHQLGGGWATGTTVVLLPEGATGGVDQRGGAPGTRETDLLAPENLVQTIDAVCLSGGSAYGLAAADGVMAWLAERGRGFRVGIEPHEVVPIVPAAVLFDLPRSDWGNRPDASFGRAACAAAAGGPVAEGCVGAGAGARTGSLKGGIGTASAVVRDVAVRDSAGRESAVRDSAGQESAVREGAGRGGTDRGAAVGEVTVGALLAVNARGEAADPETGALYAASVAPGEFPPAPGRPGALSAPTASDLNTVIGVIATDAALTKAQCRRLAMAGHDGLARALRPAHSVFDGDTLFAAATGAREVQDPMAFDRLCAAAADVVAVSVGRAVLAATTVGDLRAYRDAWP